MFIMDIPYVPMQETSIVLAQAASPGAGSTRQPDYILKICQETESTLESPFNGVDPAGWLAVNLENILRHPPIDTATTSSIKAILLEGTTHGKLIPITSSDGHYHMYKYNPEPDYLGKDKAIFMAEFEGKRYKIVMNFVVTLQVVENPLLPGETPVCPKPQFIKVTKPTAGALSSTHVVVEYSAISPTHRSSGTPLEARRPSTSYMDAHFFAKRSIHNVEHR